MTQEPTTPDLFEIRRRMLQAASRRDVDEVLSRWPLAPDAIWDDSALGLGTHEGLAAIRQHLEDWYGSYDEFEMVGEELRDLGNGVTFDVNIQKGRPTGSTGYVQLRYASVTVWVKGRIKRFTTYTDIDEARAAAERLAEERAQADV
jgi:ketosteroid isomerase-like protein